MSFVPTKRVIVVIDLAGYTKAVQSEGDLKAVKFLQGFYTECEKSISGRGGTIIKFMGDACLAIFPADRAHDAVKAVLDLQSSINALAARDQLQMTLGANLHLTSAIEAELGTGPSKRRDIIGRGVNQTFLLGRGSGIRISEPVYRALPSAARSAWIKHKPPAVYHMEVGGG
jgi:class 3 adenylate cyclase